MTYLDNQDPHEIIDATHVVERYVLGKLDEQEQSDFEDHFVECARCLEAVELAQELRDGLITDRDQRQSAPPNPAASETEGIVIHSSAWKPWTSRAVWLPAAAVLLISLLPSIFLFQSRSHLQHQVEQLRQPRVNLPDVVLQIQRQSATAGINGPADANVPIVDPSSPWITLALELGPPEPANGVQGHVLLDLEILNEKGDRLWQETGLAVPKEGRLTLSVPTPLLDGESVPDSSFRVDAFYRHSERPEACLAPCEDDRVEPVGSFRFALSKPRSAESGSSAQ